MFDENSREVRIRASEAMLKLIKSIDDILAARAKLKQEEQEKDANNREALAANFRKLSAAITNLERKLPDADEYKSSHECDVSQDTHQLLLARVGELRAAGNWHEPRLVPFKARDKAHDEPWYYAGNLNSPQYYGEQDTDSKANHLLKVLSTGDQESTNPVVQADQVKLISDAELDLLQAQQARNRYVLFVSNIITMLGAITIAIEIISSLARIFPGTNTNNPWLKGLAYAGEVPFEAGFLYLSASTNLALNEMIYGQLLHFVDSCTRLGKEGWSFALAAFPGFIFKSLMAGWVSAINSVPPFNAFAKYLPTLLSFLEFSSMPVRLGLAGLAFLFHTVILTVAYFHVLSEFMPSKIYSLFTEWKQPESVEQAVRDAREGIYKNAVRVIYPIGAISIIVRALFNADSTKEAFNEINVDANEIVTNVSALSASVVLLAFATFTFAKVAKGFAMWKTDPTGFYENIDGFGVLCKQLLGSLTVPILIAPKVLKHADWVIQNLPQLLYFNYGSAVIYVALLVLSSMLYKFASTAQGIVTKVQNSGGESANAILENPNYVNDLHRDGEDGEDVEQASRTTGCDCFEKVKGVAKTAVSFWSSSNKDGELPAHQQFKDEEAVIPSSSPPSVGVVRGCESEARYGNISMTLVSVKPILTEIKLAWKLVFLVKEQESC